MNRFKNVLSICAAMFTLALGAQTTRTVYIDVYGNNGPAGWNNFSFTTSANTALLHDSSTNATGIRATVDIRISGANSYSATSLSGDAAEFAPASNNAAFGTGSEYSQITISSLNTNLTYAFTFFGSRTSVSDNRETRHTVTGSNEGYADLNAAGNNSNVATVSGIYPRPDGTITLRFERSPNNTSSFYYLTAMKIVYTEPPPEVVYVDAAGTTVADGWNLLCFSKNSDTMLFATNGAATGIRAQVTTPLDPGLNANATTPPTGDAAEFGPMGTQNAFGHNELHQGTLFPLGEAKLYFMNPNIPYTFTFYASRMGVTDNRHALYTVTGANSGSQSLNASGNYQNVAVVSGILPAADGTVTIRVEKAPENTHSWEYFYIGAFKITYTDKGLPLPPPPDIAGKRLLIFGNQYTSTGDILGQMADFAEFGGFQRPFVVSDLADNRTLANHIARVENFPGFNVDHVSFTGTNTWDYVVMQGHGDESSALGDNQAFRTNALALYQKIKGHVSGKGAGSKAVLYQTWARGDGSAVYPGTFAHPEAMQSEISANYAVAAGNIEAAESVGSVLTAPIGEAFGLGGFDAGLYAENLSDPGNMGQVLAALSLYRTIYGTNVAGWADGYDTALNAGVTTLRERDWIKVTHWVDGLAAPEPQKPQAGEPEVIYLDAYLNNDPARYLGWNYVSFTRQNEVLENMVLSNGYVTQVACEIVNRMRNVNTYGTASPTGEAAQFAAARDNNAYSSVNPFGGYSDAFCDVRFSGLNPQRGYTFTFYASRIGGSGNLESLYTVTGANSGSAALDARNNSSNVAVVPKIRPKADGTIDLNITAGPNNASSEKFYYLAAMKIESVGGGLLIMFK